ncbi:hypothetical protein V6N11_009905 [Hibiscus sabdariffa]|uniref:NADPH-protochlorophyllide oxidoreductase n=1 Tax=Hibiscus sabdariffa TaxID=183260 RepID=A0ABR2PD17_9ROSI
MALQAAALLPSTFSAPKEGKSAASFKDSSLFGVSLSDHIKADFTTSALRCKREFNQRTWAVRAQTTATATPAITRSSMDGKKTLRKGSVIITGASSGLGLATAKALAETGKWHVIMACRDFLKAERAAKSAGMSKENYTIMHLDLASLDSVRQFVDSYKRSGRPLDVLVCNAAVYQPTAKEPSFTAEGFELSVGTNHLGHFLLSRLLLDDLKQSDYPSKRLIIVGSITGNTNTLAGNVPPKANLGDLRGLAGGLNGLNSSTMIDGGEFDGAKAYKDSKVCNMLTMQEFHRRFHEETGITFASLYPGCIATTGLFREHIPLFRLLFPPFQKYITKGFVSEDEAGKRLAQVVSDPSLTKSGVYWSWNKASASFENQLSQEASDQEKARKIWELSEKLRNQTVESTKKDEGDPERPKRTLSDWKDKEEAEEQTESKTDSSPVFRNNEKVMCRKHQDLYMWMAKSPNGPSVKFFVNAGNFEKDVHWKLLKGMIIQVGPRFSLNPIKTFAGSFGGPTLYENHFYVSPNQMWALERPGSMRRKLKLRQGGEKKRHSGPKLKSLYCLVCFDVCSCEK